MFIWNGEKKSSNAGRNPVEGGRGGLGDTVSANGPLEPDKPGNKRKMKKIIEWKRYDTETATAVASWWNGCGSNDFNHCREILYLTPNKAWFLHGEGGPLSRYAEAVEGGRCRSAGSDIIPLTEADAAAWLAEYKPSKFEKYFSHLAKDA